MSEKTQVRQMSESFRSATVAWIAWRRTRQSEARQQALYYAGIICIFLTGAAIAVPFVGTFQEAAIALPISSLFIAGLLMIIHPEKRD